MLTSRPLLHDNLVFWSAYDVYVHAYNVYAEQAKQGLMLDHQAVGLALMDALCTRVRSIRSMRVALRQDPEIDTREHVLPDLASREDTEARAMLGKYWHKYAGTVACVCKNATRYFYDL
ncbi:hypothetical protein GCM10010129_82290 [Streptomyces fumigatiscleroticus]|nr:hypothetical protein GCM10010129_82290 [Streptomyces fumigatiscleroticus]